MSAPGWSAAVWIAAAGALGCALRHGVVTAVLRLTGRSQWGTFAVNLLGCFLIGLVVAQLTARGLAESRWRPVLTTGFLGGFTTYSAFALESVQLVERERWTGAAVYLVATWILAPVCCWIGLWCGRLTPA